MTRQYLSDAECDALGLPHGCYFGDDYATPDVAHAVTEGPTREDEL